MFSKSILKNLLSKLILASLVLSFSAHTIPVASAEDFEGTTYLVNSSGNSSDQFPEDQICSTFESECTLRAAIQQSKTDGTDSMIIFDVDTVLLDQELPLIDHENKLIIKGSSTTIDAQGMSRFFTTKEGADLTIESVNFENAAIGTADPEAQILDNGGSISVWINPVSTGENGIGRILDKDLEGPDGWVLWINSQSNGKAKLSFGQRFSQSIGMWRTNANEIDLSAWQHIALNYQKESLDSTPEIYIDGVKVGISKVNPPAGELISDAGNDLYIGNRADGQRTFHGSIDEVALFNKMLSEEEITTLFEHTNNFSEAISYWNFGEGSGDVVGDFKNDNDGQISNADFVNGKYGKALSFDGTNGYVKVNDHETIQDIFNTNEPTPGPAFHTLWGGAINNNGDLTLNNVSIKDGTNLIDTTTWDSTNSLCMCGGVIKNAGNLTIQNSEISNNQSTIELKAGTQGLQAKGGVICNNGDGHVVLDNTTISDNQVIVNSNNGIAEHFSLLGGAIASYSYFESIEEGQDGNIGKNSNTQLEVINGSQITNNKVKLNGDIRKSFVWGGGIYNTGHMIVDNSNIDGNELSSIINTEHCQCTRVEAHGAGIYSRDSKEIMVDKNYDDNFIPVELETAYNVSIKNSSISDNLVNISGNSNVDKVFASGAGMLLSHYHSETLEPLENLTINNNKIAAYLKNGDLVRAGGAGLQMGVAYTIQDSTATIKNSTLDNNELEVSGIETNYVEAEGAAIRSAETLILDSTTVSNNIAIENGSKSAGLGGGIYSHRALKLINSTISGNTIGDDTLNYDAAVMGAAIFGPSENSSVEIVNSTVTNNKAKKELAPETMSLFYEEDDLKAPAIAVYGSLNVRNSIISNNNATTKNCKPKYVDGEMSDLTLESGGYNIFDDFSCGTPDITDTDQENVDPLIEALADNGGLTKTHALQVDSPAMDRIPLESCTDLSGNQLVVDQRGETRPMPAEGICDIGAYESPIGNPDNINASFPDELPEQFDITVGFDNGGGGSTEADTSAEIKVVLSDISNETISVDYKFWEEDSSATNGEDFILQNGTLTFAPGEIEKTIEIEILDDNEYEEKGEKIKLYLTNAQNAGINDKKDIFSYKITDDELGPQDGSVQVLFTSGYGQIEENKWGVNYTVELTKPSEEAVTVKFQKAESSTAVEGEDFEFPQNGELVFEPGETEKFLKMILIDDLEIEEDKSLTIELYEPTNAELGSVTSKTTLILENDTEESIAYENAVKAHFWAGGGHSKTEDLGSGNYQIFLSAPSEDFVSVQFTVLGSSTATEGEDYIIEDEKTLVFEPGEVQKTFYVKIIDDDEVEEDETINFVLVSATNAILGEYKTYTATILNNDVAEESSEEEQASAEEAPAEEAPAEEVPAEEAPAEEAPAEESPAEEPPTEEAPAEEGYEDRFEMFFSKTRELRIILDKEVTLEIEELLKTAKDPKAFLEDLEKLFRSRRVRISAAQWEELSKYIMSVAEEEPSRTELRSEEEVKATSSPASRRR